MHVSIQLKFRKRWSCRRVMWRLVGNSLRAVQQHPRLWVALYRLTEFLSLCVSVMNVWVPLQTGRRPPGLSILSYHKMQESICVPLVRRVLLIQILYRNLLQFSVSFKWYTCMECDSGSFCDVNFFAYVQFHPSLASLHLLIMCYPVSRLQLISLLLLFLESLMLKSFRPAQVRKRLHFLQ